jgi:type I restriction enzyme R subunit
MASRCRSTSQAPSDPPEPPDEPEGDVPETGGLDGLPGTTEGGDDFPPDGTDGGSGEGCSANASSTSWPMCLCTWWPSACSTTAADGKLITESLRDYTRSCVQKQFGSLDAFLRRWSDADQKTAIIEELANQGVLWDALQEEVEAKLGKPLDPFDLVCHVAFDQPPLSRKERAENVKKRNYFAKYQGAARQVLEALLDKYADTGLTNIEDIKILQLDPFSKIGAPMELIKAFGGKAGYQQAVTALEQQLYG